MSSNKRRKWLDLFFFLVLPFGAAVLAFFGLYGGRSEAKSRATYVGDVFVPGKRAFFRAVALEEKTATSGDYVFPQYELRAGDERIRAKQKKAADGRWVEGSFDLSQARADAFEVWAVGPHDARAFVGQLSRKLSAGSSNDPRTHIERADAYDRVVYNKPRVKARGVGWGDQVYLKGGLCVGQARCTLIAVDTAAGAGPGTDATWEQRGVQDAQIDVVEAAGEQATIISFMPIGTEATLSYHDRTGQRVTLEVPVTLGAFGHRIEGNELYLSHWDEEAVAFVDAFEGKVRVASFSRGGAEIRFKLKKGWRYEIRYAEPNSDSVLVVDNTKSEAIPAKNETWHYRAPPAKRLRAILVRRGHPVIPWIIVLLGLSSSIFVVRRTARSEEAARAVHRQAEIEGGAVNGSVRYAAGALMFGVYLLVALMIWLKA